MTVKTGMKRTGMMAAKLLTRLLAVMIGGVILSVWPTGQALAQDNLFRPAVTVNGTVVTQYELRQRILFLQVLRQPGDLPKEAIDGLIQDRLRSDAAKKLGVTVAPDEITAGMAEFAARANLSTDAFLKAIAPGGVEPETFRDFVQAGILWRSVIRAHFGGQVHVTAAEVDRAIANGAASGGALRVLLSEIVIPTGGKDDAMAIALRLKQSITTPAAFAIAAQNYSKSGTAKAGGALDWIEVPTLPKDVAPKILALKPGEITAPIAVTGAVELFLLRDISQSAGAAKGTPQVDYARFTPPAGSDLQALRGKLDGCADLNTAARGLPANSLQRQTVAESSLPPDLQGLISGLDASETAVLPGGAALIMLCSRNPLAQVAASRDDVTTELLNRKLGLLAASYMEELRSDAIIVLK